MALISSIVVSSLAVVGTVSNNIVQAEPYNFFDPLGYTEYNLLNDTQEKSYSEIRETIYEDNMFYFHDFIWEGELYLEIYNFQSDILSTFLGLSDETVNLIFKADCDNKSVEYLRYLPSYEWLVGIIEL